MIVKGFADVAIGTVITNGFITDAEANKHYVPFMVLRVATREEYIEYCISNGAKLGMIFDNDKFYEISVD